MLTLKGAGQGVVVCLGHDALSYPLPELSLRGPELLPIPADYQRCFLLLFLFLVLVCAHFFLVPMTRDTCALVCFFAYPREIANTQYPEGKPLMRGGIKFSNWSAVTRHRFGLRRHGTPRGLPARGPRKTPQSFTKFKRTMAATGRDRPKR